MKSPFSHQNQLRAVPAKQKKMLDMAVMHKPVRNATPASLPETLRVTMRAGNTVSTAGWCTAVGRPVSSVKNSLHAVRAHSAQLSVFMKRGGLDGIRTEKHAFLKQLQTWSLTDIVWRSFRKTELYYRFVKRTMTRFVLSITPRKMLYGSLVGGVAFGIISMGFIEHFFGPGVFARSAVNQPVAVATAGAPAETNPAVLGESTDSGQTDYNSGTDIFFEYFNETADKKYKENVREMVKGYPIEAMLPYIFEQDQLTAAFLIGIAKKESNWGKRVPVLADQDCFNYWGYRGIRRLMGTGGHTCFNSSKDAVKTVATRLNTLIHSNKLNTPEKMVVWKCGFSCSGQNREDVKKWIADVDMYFEQVTE